MQVLSSQVFTYNYIFVKQFKQRAQNIPFPTLKICKASR